MTFDKRAGEGVLVTGLGVVFFLTEFVLTKEHV